MQRCRILIVEDFAPFRRFVCSTLQQEGKFQVIGEAADGLEAVQKAAGLKPDLILLDIGLPTLNGIEAARRMSAVAPASKIIFVSQNHDPDIMKAALKDGAWAYVFKSRDASELLTAIAAVLRGERFVSRSLGST